MSAQDLEQRARELLVKWRYAEPANGSMASQNRRDAFRRCANELESVLRHQPAPVDLEQFRDAVECWGSHRRSGRGDPRVAAEAQRLLALIDNSGKMEVLARGWFHRLPDGDYDIHDEASGAGKDCDGCIPCLIVSQDHAHQPAPVVGDARMARALEWVRVMAMQDADGSHVPAIEEAIAAYDPNCGARTVRVVDDALADTQRAIIEAAERRGYERAKAEIDETTPPEHK